MKDELGTFGWGVAGSFLVEFYRLFNIVVLQQLPLPPVPWYYYVFSLGSIVCGGLWACVWGAGNRRNSFYLGATWGLGLTALLSKTPEITATLTPIQ